MSTVPRCGLNQQTWWQLEKEGHRDQVATRSCLRCSSQGSCPQRCVCVCVCVCVCTCVCVCSVPTKSDFRDQSLSPHRCVSISFILLHGNHLYLCGAPKKKHSVQTEGTTRPKCYNDLLSIKHHYVHRYINVCVQN